MRSASLLVMDLDKSVISKADPYDQHSFASSYLYADGLQVRENWELRYPNHLDESEIPQLCGLVTFRQASDSSVLVIQSSLEVGLIYEIGFLAMRYRENTHRKFWKQ